MNKYMDETIGEDAGIDFENYNLQEEIEKYSGDHPQGWQIVIRVYVPPQVVKTKGGILLPPTTTTQLNQDAKFTNLTGLVIKMAPGAYKDTRYDLTGPYCKVGDWVMFPRAHGHTYAYNGMTTITINEDAILKVIADPRVITRLTSLI